MFKSYIFIPLLTFFVADQYAMARSNDNATKKRLEQKQVAQHAFMLSITEQDPVALAASLRNKLVDPNKIASDQLPPLVAVILGCNDATKCNRMVRTLLQHKADPNIPSHFPVKGKKVQQGQLGLYPLHFAVFDQNAELVKMLLQAKARVNALTEKIQIPKKDSDTLPVQGMPLHFACNPGKELNFDIVRMLVEAGANINARAPVSGNTPLHLAIANGNLQAIAYLLKKGASCTIVNAIGFTPVHEATIRDDICALWMLYKYTDINHLRKHPDERKHAHIMILGQDSDAKVADSYHIGFENYTPLHIAAGSGSTSMLQELLTLGANPNCRAFRGVYPLHIAVTSGDVTQEVYRERVRLLLQAGADPDVTIQLPLGNLTAMITPMLFALRYGLYGVVDDMCAWYSAHQRSIKLPYVSYITAVMKKSDLSFEEQCALIQKFISLGDDIHYMDDIGNLLHVAVALQENPRMIEHLIQLGVRVDQPNKNNFLPFDHALIMKDQPIIDCLKPYQAAKLSQFYAVATGSSSSVDEQHACRLYDARIGDVTRLQEYALFFNDTPGNEHIMKILDACGTGDALKKYAVTSRQGAINTARGALFELNAAYHLMLERYELKAFRVIYEGLEYDIETLDYLVECKNIKWSAITGRRIEDLKRSLIKHNDVVKRMGKKYLFYSKNQIPQEWREWLVGQDITWVEYKDIPSPNQNKIREQYLMPLLNAQTMLCQRTSSLFQ